MKHLYNGKTTRCGMMVSVDLFGQCTDSNRTNNVAVFPVRLSVNETRGKKEINLGYKILRVLIVLQKYITKNIFHAILSVEEVRESVQLNWPDAETGVDAEDQDMSCSVLTNSMDNGKHVLMSLLRLISTKLLNQKIL